MNEQNIEMLNELRKFVIETARSPKEATPAQFQAMTEAARILVEYDEYSNFTTTEEWLEYLNTPPFRYSNLIIR